MTNPLEKYSPEVAQLLLGEQVIGLAQAAKIANCHPKTLERLLKRGQGPRIIRLNTHKMGVRLKDLQAWLDSTTVSMADDDAA